MRRGEVWILSGGPDYAGKPRPVVIVHNDGYFDHVSATVIGFTSKLVDAPMTRISIGPSATNGLFVNSQVMIDKITTVPQSKIGKKIGSLTADDMGKIDEALLTYLGLLK